MALNVFSVLFSKGKTTGLILEELGRGDVRAHSVCKENSWFQTFQILLKILEKKIKRINVNLCIIVVIFFNP